MSRHNVQAFDVVRHSTSGNTSDLGRIAKFGAAPQVVVMGRQVGRRQRDIQPELGIHLRHQAFRFQTADAGPRPPRRQIVGGGKGCAIWQ
jgi:hypothetical protein